MAEFVRALSVEELPKGQGRKVDLGGRAIALFNADGEFYALDARCPHRGGPLAEGYLDGASVTCPLHGFAFSLRDGRGVDGVELEVASFDTMVENGEVLVRVR
jgi:nitrite reductase (NADH) small subunit